MSPKTFAPESSNAGAQTGSNEHLLVAQGRVLEMIVRDEPLEAVLAAICRSVESLTAGVQADIALFERDALDRKMDAVAVANANTAGTWSQPILSSSGAKLGTFTVSHAGHREPTAAERQRVGVLAQTAALAIERRQGDDALRGASQRDRFLAQLASATQAIASPEAVMALTAQMLAEHLSADRCAYAEVDHERDFVITGDFTRGVASIVGRWPVAAFGPACEEAMRAGVPYVVVDSAADARISAEHRAAYEATQIRSVICVPLHKHRQLSAAMAVHCVMPRRWTPEEIDLVSIVVARCWEALERAAAGQALRDSRARLDYAVRLSGVGFWYCDLPFSELQWDENTKAHFFLRPDSRVSIEQFYEHIHPADRDNTRRAIESSIATREPYDVVYRTQDATGTQTKWIRALGGTAYDREGNPVRFDGVTVDVTKEKLDQIQLAQLLERLREEDRLKDEFLATLAHELRNPLAPIVTGLEVMARTDDPAIAADLRSMMARQVRHLVRLVDDLLDLSRITLGKVRLETRRIDLREAIDSALVLAQPVIAASQHRLTLEIADEPMPLEADSTRLAQVIANLLSNAAKYTAPGGRISLRTRREGAQVALDVIDDGIGIEREWLPRVFDLFTQVAPGAQASQGGLGIGLTLVRRLTELHGGIVTATSEGRGLGSTFTVRLPLAGSGADARVQREVATSGPVPLRILLVDDNEDAVRSLQMLLELDGHRVDIAYDGEAALVAAASGRHALIVLDIGLPGIDGYEVCRQLRLRLAESPTIVALTGWGAEEDRRRAREAGFDDHLVKPGDPVRIAALVQRAAASPLRD